MGDAETDGANQEEIAGEEFEVGLDGVGNIGVVVLAERGFPEK
ncbi:MAG: hypothetical protein ACJA16_004010 [Akkermansiaceae bacterium]|jgi:hypothetical protein